MTLSRSILLLVVLVSISAYAADSKQQQTTPTPEASMSTTLESLHLVPWFTGMKHVNRDLKHASKLGGHADPASYDPGVLKGVSCLKLRAYKVRGQETLSDGESAFVSYSTCQWVTIYQVRSAVQTVQDRH